VPNLEGNSDVLSVGLSSLEGIIAVHPNRLRIRKYSARLSMTDDLESY